MPVLSGGWTLVVEVCEGTRFSGQCSCAVSIDTMCLHVNYECRLIREALPSPVFNDLLIHSTCRAIHHFVPSVVKMRHRCVGLEP